MSQKFNIALTGANGFVGRQILKELLRRNCSVRCIVRDKKSLLELVSSEKVEAIEVKDLFQMRDSMLHEVVEGIKILIHPAWHVPPGNYLDGGENLTCLHGTLNIATAFIKAGGEKFVGVGTCGEYAASSDPLRVDSPLGARTLYAASKAAVFQVLTNYLGPQGVSFAWCRLFYLYGEGEHPDRLVPYIHRQLARGEKILIKEGAQILDFMDVQAAGAAIAQVALGKNSGAFNICSGVGTSVKDLAQRLAREYGKSDLLEFEHQNSEGESTCIVGCPSVIY